jgi:hypothetical protein
MLTPKTEVERSLITKLQGCKLPAISHDRSEIRSLGARPGAVGLTSKDRLLLASLCWKYRKQIDFKVWEYEFVASLFKLMPGMEGKPSRGSGQSPELVVSGTKS